MSQTAVWKISLSNLSRNLLEATELANVLQEVSSSIQVTGLSSSLSGRLSSSTSGTPTKLSTRERIKYAVPVHIGAGAVPWQQLVAVVPSDALQNHISFDQADNQPQVLEVNTGGTVFFLFFRLTRKQHQHYLQQQQQLQQQLADGDHRVSSSSSSSSSSSAPFCRTVAQTAAAPAGVQFDGDICASHAPVVAGTPHKQAVPGSIYNGLSREGIAVLKVGFSRLAMQAEQFANELTRHLGIAAPDCRIVRQVGSTADEWTKAVDAVNRLAGCSCPLQKTPPAAAPAAQTSSSTSSTTSCSSSNGASSQSTTPSSSIGSNSSNKVLNVRISSSSSPMVQHVNQPCAGDQAATSSNSDTNIAPDASASAAVGAARSSAAAGRASNGGASGQADCASCLACGGANVSASLGAGPAELLGELSHLPCFLLMEFVEGDRLSDSPEALQGSSVGHFLEDVGCLFLLDMLLGNADRMPCMDLGWRGNANNLLYGARGTRHEGRPVAIDSSVARRPPALKASTEDAAVERLAQLLLSVPEVSRSLLQQLLGTIKREAGRSTRLSTSDSCSGDVAGWAEQQRATDGGLQFSDEDVARFQAGLRKCLHGVTQIKGLLEMVSNKVAEWIADFVADVVQLNPAVLPGPGTPGTPNPGTLRSPRPSPRPSARSLHHQANMGASGSSGGAGSTGGQPPLHQQQHYGVGGGSIGGGHSPRPSPRTSSVRNILLQASSGGGQPPPASQQQQQQHGLGSNGGRSSPKPSPRSSARNLSFHASAGGTGSSGGLPPLPIHTPSLPQQQDVAAANSTSLNVVISPAGTGSTLSINSSTPAHGSDVQVVTAMGDAADEVTFSDAGTATSMCNTSTSSGSSSSPVPQGAASAGAQADVNPDCTQHSPRRSASSLPSDSALSDSLPPLLPAGLDAAAAGGSSSSSAAQRHATALHAGSKHSPGGLKSLVKQFSPAGKALPLARRAASHLGFASIKAAICSTDASSRDGNEAAAAGSIPPALHIKPWSGHSGSLNNSLGGAGPLGDVATAVAAALSPKATEAQTQALVGVFGGGAYSVGTASSSCGRRTTWNTVDEVHNAAKDSSLEPFLAAAAASSFTGPADSRRAVSCIAPGGPVHSPQHSSTGGLGYQQQQQQTVHMSRHSSFPAHSQSLAAAAAAAAAVMSPVQQRTSSSSLQVLASIQLDATLASIKQEARHDGALAERLAHWKSVFREKGAELSKAIAAWQSRHQLAAVLSTGFLDGSHPIVDAYELGVRLQHMLRRLTALAAGAMVQVPIRVLPGVFLGNAVAADSHHLLHYLGVTHVVNAAQELQVESAPGQFQVHRVAIRDEEEEDISHHFYQVQALIESALSSGGAVLVHCHEGKSRSVALLLAYLMISKGHTLASAVAHIKSLRPEACPNAGFMSQLMVLDKQLHGATSLSRTDLPRAKPEARICSICGQPAGLSYASLVRHMKTRHKGAAGVAAVGSRYAGAASAISMDTGKATASAADTAAASATAMAIETSRS